MAVLERAGETPPPEWKDVQQRTQQFADVVRLTLGSGMVMGEATSYLNDANAVLQAQTQFSQQAGQRLSAQLAQGRFYGLYLTGWVIQEPTAVLQ